MAHSTIYQKIKEYLLEIIDQNKNNPQFMLPSEQQLCIRFNCSRIPAKRALNDLCEADIITRVPGRGSFINNSQHTYNSIFSVKTICFLLPNVSSIFSRRILIAASDEAERQGAVLFSVFSNDSNISEQFLVDSSLGKLFDGLIIFSAINDNSTLHFQKLIGKKMPVLFVARNNKKIGASAVLCDNKAVVESAVSSIQSKADKIGFISLSPENGPEYLERIEAYKKCVKRSNLPEFICPLRYDLIFTEPQKTAEQIDTFFAQHPDMNGLIVQNFCINFVSQSQAFRKTAIKSNTLVLIDQPEDNSILPFSEAIFIDQHPEEIGRLAVKQLLKEIINHEKHQEILLSPNTQIVPPNFKAILI